MYWSTSNGGPWGGQTRGNDSSDIGQFTNLWTASQLAFDGDTGKIVWGYQFTPSDVWDYDGVNEAVLADLNIGGKKTPVLMHADRNGFFYVLNRESGKLLSAEPVVPVNWAKGVDLKTGMPIEDPTKRPRLGVWARNVCPNLIGGKNWEPMSYSQQTGLVYIPLFNMCMDIANKDEEYTPGKFYLASEFNLDMAGVGRQEPRRVRGLGSGGEEEGLGHQGGPAVPERRHDHRRRPGVLRQPARRPQGGQRQDRRGAVDNSTSAPASCRARSPTWRAASSTWRSSPAAARARPRSSARSASA